MKHQTTIVYRVKSILLISLFLFSMVSCKEKEKERTENGILLELDGEILTQDEVVSRIPVGVSPADSLALFRAIVGNWIKSRLLLDFAERELPDKSYIDRKTEEYRNRLIVLEYMSRLSDKNNIDIKKDSVASFYERYKEDFIAEVPLVKGIILKIPEKSENVEAIREALKNFNDESLDYIESLRIDEDFSFDYFGDKWRNWRDISAEIPLRITDPDAWLKDNDFKELNKNKDLYFLKVIEYLPTGSQEPFEYASSRIREILYRKDMENFEKNLIDDLIKEAISSQRLVAVGYEGLN